MIALTLRPKSLRDALELPEGEADPLAEPLPEGNDKVEEPEPLPEEVTRTTDEPDEPEAVVRLAEGAGVEAAAEEPLAPLDAATIKLRGQ